LNRSMLAQNERDREYNLQHALDETLYNMPGANRQSRYYPQLATQLARILYEQEKYEEGLVVLAEAMLAQPESDVLYSAAAIIERKPGDPAAARKTVTNGHEAVGGRSAEINYNLGLICVELGDIEAAVEYAEAAYALGYPLEGLRTKLKNLGRM